MQARDPMITKAGIYAVGVMLVVIDEKTAEKLTTTRDHACVSTQPNPLK
jgi:hypothetical protein